MKVLSTLGMHIVTLVDSHFLPGSLLQHTAQTASVWQADFGGRVTEAIQPQPGSGVQGLCIVVMCRKLRFWCSPSDACNACERTCKRGVRIGRWDRNQIVIVSTWAPIHLFSLVVMHDMQAALTAVTATHQLVSAIHTLGLCIRPMLLANRPLRIGAAPDMMDTDMPEARLPSLSADCGKFDCTPQMKL